jgi:hypothetical protein
LRPGAFVVMEVEFPLLRRPNNPVVAFSRRTRVVPRIRVLLFYAN